MDKATIDVLEEIQKDLKTAFHSDYTGMKQNLISKSIGRVETLITVIKEESK